MTRIGISCEEALQTILAHMAPLGPETIPLAEGVGRSLAADVVAPHPLPAFATSGPGAYIVHAGRPLRPEEIGLLAALGLREVRVVRRPRVAIVAIGNELLAPGVAPEPGKVYDSDSALLAALVRREGGLPVPVGIAHDSEGSLRLRMAGAIARGAELILAVAGSHPGGHDLVAELLATEGRLEFYQVAVADDRPLVFGSLAGVPVLGLPGEPAQALAAAERFVRPAVRRLAGLDDEEPAQAAPAHQAAASPL
jgi:molybdopterin molybdotransferase